MKNVDPLRIEDLVVHIFDGGKESIDDFQADFSAQGLSICEYLRQCFGHFLRFDRHPEADEQFSQLTADVYSLVEALYTSTKLLVYGFLSPSGNQFRVALESLAVSVLLSYRGKLLVSKKLNCWSERDFYTDFKENKRWARSHLAIKILSRNIDLLGLSERALKLLQESKVLYNNYSHVSLLSIRAVIVNPHKVVFGGGWVRPKTERAFCKRIGDTKALF
jgi:hypothetical protein